MSVLAVIPARMGSTRLPRKNLLEIETGLTLLQQAIDSATGSGLVDEVVVSTDDKLLPIRNARLRIRPAEICGPTADISDAVYDAWQNTDLGVHDWVVTLQPAVLARSQLIVRSMITECISRQCSAITMAHTVPWIWQHSDQGGGMADVPWLRDGRYPRSQDSAEHFAEVNAVTVAPASAVRKRCRWSLPLLIASLPSWAIALDIDNPGDLVTARGLWPWARRELETFTPRFHQVNDLSGFAEAAQGQLKV